MADDKPEPTAHVACAQPAPGLVELTLSGRLDADGVAAVWAAADDLVRRSAAPALRIEAAAVTWCDSAGIALLLHLERLQADAGRRTEVVGLPDAAARTLAEARAQAAPPPPARPERTPLVEDLGHYVRSFGDDTRRLVAYVGQLSVGLVGSFLHPHEVRWRDAFLAAERAAVNALPIVALISFLIGMIMGFQSAIPLERFGAERFVAELVALSMVRELGPLMTALLLAGRTGSALAAELGTMKVNEELDALTTMGVDPVRFLVVPRVLALVVMTPLLALFADLLGLLGGLVVYRSFGLPLEGFLRQVQDIVELRDVFGGLFKAWVFGVLVAGIGCWRGLETGKTPSAVGASATRAVVSGIILVVVADGILAVLYYALEI